MKKMSKFLVFSFLEQLSKIDTWFPVVLQGRPGAFRCYQWIEFLQKFWRQKQSSNPRNRWRHFDCWWTFLLCYEKTLNRKLVLDHLVWFHIFIDTKSIHFNHDIYNLLMKILLIFSDIIINFNVVAIMF